MQAKNVYLVWKVDAAEPDGGECTFDARVLFHDRIGMPLEQLMRGSAESPKSAYFDHAVPFELSLPNRPFTLVVRAHGASPIAMSLETHDDKGPTGTGHWCRGSSGIIVHTLAGSMSTSLPDEAIDEVPTVR